MSTTITDTSLAGKTDPFSSLDALLNKARNTAASKRGAAAPAALAAENPAPSAGVADKEAEASYLAAMSLLGSNDLGGVSMGSHALDADRVAKLLEM